MTTSQSELTTSLSGANITFVGGGNMAMSLIKGLVKDHQGQIRVSDPDKQQLARYEGLPVDTFTDNNAALEGSDILVLAVKPQLASTVLTNLSTISTNHLVISIAAGIDLASLTAWTNAAQPIVRCMPNTPALLGAGMTTLFANNHCEDKHKQQAEGLLNAAGETLWVDKEHLLDAVTAVSGSGPAYYFLLMEAMVLAGVKLGLSEEIATKLTLQTAYGSAQMGLAGEDTPTVLREKVTSPGGTTAAALKVMQDNNLSEIIDQALAAANSRAAELAEEFGHK